MTVEKKRGWLTKEGTSKKRVTKPLDIGDCTCHIQRSTVGEDHVKNCSLYRQCGTGISVLNGPREQGHVEWWSANGHTSLQSGKREK